MSLVEQFMSIAKRAGCMALSYAPAMRRGAARGLSPYLIALAVSVLGAPVAFGVTPEVVWDGNFDEAKVGYTLNLSGNALSQDKSTITIDQDVGVKVDFSTGFTTAMTVMFKYSDLSFDAQKTLATSFCSGGDENRTGVYLASGGTVNGIWNTANWNNPMATLSAASGTLAFCYSKSAGTSLYLVESGSRTELYNKSNLKAGSDTAINGCAVGGERAKTGATLLSAATGMKITGIAIFDGILTEADMTGYIWPSEVQEISIDSDTTVSQINNQLDAATKGANVTVADGVTITLDEEFRVPSSVASDGTITLSAQEQPDASYFSRVDFSGVQGGLIRSWLTPGVAGFNFRSANGSDVSGALVAGDNWIHDNNSASGSSTAMFADGLSTLTWSSANTWSCSGSTIISGYLDDGANGGNGAVVKLSNVPYETYDVVIYASSDSNGDFLAKTVNGTTYTWDTAAGEVVEGSSTWGKSALTIPIYGVNALRIKGLSGPLTIYGTARNGDHRGGIAAIQIMPPETPDNVRVYRLTLDGTATTWSGGNWTLEGNVVDAPTSGNVEIVASASTSLTVDQEVSLAALDIVGGENIVVNIANGTDGSLYAIRATIQSGVFQQGSASVLGTTPALVVKSGATFDINGHTFNADVGMTLAGAGAGNWPWALTSSSANAGTAFAGATLSDNTTIGGPYRISIGKSVTSNDFHLNGYTLTKVGVGDLYCTNLRFFGGGTLDLQEGNTSFNQWTSLDGYETIDRHTTVNVHTGASLINNAGRRLWIDTLNVYGGTVTTTASGYFGVSTAFNGSCETTKLEFNGGATATLSGDLTLTTLVCGEISFATDEDTDLATVKVAGTLESTGNISVGEGVRLSLGANRPEGVLTFVEGSFLELALAYEGEIPKFYVSAEPDSDSITLYDTDGTTEISPIRVVYDGTAGTITIRTSTTAIWENIQGDSSFDNIVNWGGDRPSAGMDIVVSVTEDTDISIYSTYTVRNMTVTGNGRVRLYGASGGVTADNLYVVGGATLVRGEEVKVDVKGMIDIEEGTVLAISNRTEMVSIKGAGAVETFGDVIMGITNSFTGGITAKTGTLKTTAVDRTQWRTGFGDYNTGWACTALRRIAVEDGASLDIANFANQDIGYALTIAGKGVLQNGVYSGAVTYSGSNAIGNNSRQVSSITLSGDALVDVGVGWGLVHAGHNQAQLVLNGHTLTIRGSGGSTPPTVPMVNVAATSSGTVVLDGVKLQLTSTACNLSGASIVARGGSKLDFATAPSAIHALTLLPLSADSYVVATEWHLPEGFKPTVSTASIDTTGLRTGDVITLFEAPEGTTLEASGFIVNAGDRYTVEFSENFIEAIVNTLGNFLHYDFNTLGSGLVGRKADDSRGELTSLGGDANEDPVYTRNGKAMKVISGSTPWWDGNSIGEGDDIQTNVSPFHNSEMSVMTLVRPKEADSSIIWGLGSAWDSGVALIVKDTSTVSLYGWSSGAAPTEIVSVTDIANLTGGYHFIAVIATSSETTLWVDKQSQTVATAIPSMNQCGQFGSIHGDTKGFNAAGAAGFCLDDWLVYDSKLSDTEIVKLRSKLRPDPFSIHLR